MMRFLWLTGALSGSLVKENQHFQVQDTVHRYRRGNNFCQLCSCRMISQFYWFTPDFPILQLDGAVIDYHMVSRHVQDFNMPLLKLLYTLV